MMKMDFPGAKMSNNTLTRPSSSGVMAPPKLKMPATAGKKMPRSNAGALSHLGPELKPMPVNPLQPMRVGATPSLFHTNGGSGSGLSGIGR